MCEGQGVEPVPLHAIVCPSYEEARGQKESCQYMTDGGHEIAAASQALFG